MSKPNLLAIWAKHERGEEATNEELGHLIERFECLQDRLEQAEREAKAEALGEAAAEIDRLESIGDTARNQVSEDQEKDYWRFHGTPITDWLRDRADRYREQP